jgi:hypothetical protein
MAVEEAPMDGKLYGRKDGAWVEIVPVPGPRGIQGLTGGLGASGLNGGVANYKYYITEKVTHYTLALGDESKLIRLTSSDEIHLIIPLNSLVAFEIGTCIAIAQGGIGKVKVVPADPAVVINTPDDYFLAKRYAKAAIIKVDTNTWELDGNLFM